MRFHKHHERLWPTCFPYRLRLRRNPLQRRHQVYISPCRLHPCALQALNPRDKDKNWSYSTNKPFSSPSISPASPSPTGGSVQAYRKGDPYKVNLSHLSPPQSPPPSRTRVLALPIPTGLLHSPIFALPIICKRKYQRIWAPAFEASSPSSQTQGQSRQRPIPLPKRESPYAMNLQTPLPPSSSSPIPTALAASVSGPASISPTPDHGQQTQHEDVFRLLPTPLRTLKPLTLEVPVLERSKSCRGGYR
ncbi:hypothetical protein BDN72DRAFT_620487 [Pluteus cervinus]|uniref:Uncharacterized protein n=1 Tax=Pluteus cervinus TaxID=181527 RepID=A0ACD3AU83_9AGAR|nr:hypothetical protein BDN72DRAFT_620487 [Pluteus cervinus]